MLKLSESDVTKQVRDFLEFRQWRIVRMNAFTMPGASSEPGIPDLLAIWYDRQGGAQAWNLTLWLEMKRPNARMACRCKIGARRKCTFCAQRDWKEREKARGAAVWTVSSFPAFEELYWQRYGFLHKEEQARARGQNEMELGPGH